MNHNVRDEGVAGSNPATPTRFPNNNPLPPQVAPPVAL